MIELKSIGTLKLADGINIQEAANAITKDTISFSQDAKGLYQIFIKKESAKKKEEKNA